MKRLKKFFKVVIVGIIICLVVLFGINVFMAIDAKGRLYYEASLAPAGYDNVIVLGASKWGDEPSPILRDRLLQGIELYNEGKASCMIMSGDHELPDYDEVTVMCEYAKARGVAEDDIVGDIYGLSTYDSMYRAKNVYGYDKVIIVTQRYHMFRSLYIAKRMGLDAVGVCAEHVSYNGDIYREIRETLARTKDLIKCIVKPASKYSVK